MKCLVNLGALDSSEVHQLWPTGSCTDLTIAEPLRLPSQGEVSSDVTATKV